MKKLTWNTEAGRQMWLEGKKDSEIADEFGVATATVAAYRKRHWEKLLPQQTLNAIRKSAKEAGGKLLPAGPRIDVKTEEDNPSAAPMGVTTSTVQGSALEGMKPVPPAMIVGSGGPLAEQERIVASPSAPRNDVQDSSTQDQPDPRNDTEEGVIPNVPVINPKKNPLAGVRKQTPDVMDVMAAATVHLSGMQAVCRQYAPAAPSRHCGSGAIRKIFARQRGISSICCSCWRMIRMENEGSGIIAPWRRSGVVLRLPCLPGEFVRFKGLLTHWVVSAINLYAEGKPTASVTNGKITQTMPLTELADADFAGRIGHPVIIPPGMTAWIPAAKELPSEEAVREHYARYRQDPKYIVMIFGGILPTILSFDGNYFYDENTQEPYGVTYWMELPAPPATTPQSACPADSSPDKGSQGDAEKETI